MKQSSFYGGKEYIKKWLSKEEEQGKVDYKKLANNVKENIYKIRD